MSPKKKPVGKKAAKKKTVKRPKDVGPVVPPTQETEVPPKNVVGTVIVTWNHYREEVEVVNGRLQNVVLDDLLAIGYVYKNSLLKLGGTTLACNDLDAYFTELTPGETYALEVVEDPAEHAAYLARRKPLKFDATTTPCATASDLITNELKKLTEDELRTQSGRYQELLEAREREDVMFM